MKTLSHLFDNNQRWASQISKSEPLFFSKLAHQQSPEFLWIGCSDSRVPANEIVGLLPGELFVHRNVANLVIHTDLNCLSVLQYAIDVLKVKHIIVCGHYGCGGVKAALETHPHGLIDNWLQHIRDIFRRHTEDLLRVTDPEDKLNLLCELNVVEQVINVVNTTIVQEAWQRMQKLTVHGWIYSLSNGLLKDMEVSLSSADELIQLEGKMRTSSGN